MYAHRAMSSGPGAGEGIRPLGVVTVRHHICTTTHGHRWGLAVTSGVTTSLARQEMRMLTLEPIETRQDVEGVHVNMENDT